MGAHVRRVGGDAGRLDEIHPVVVSVGYGSVGDGAHGPSMRGFVKVEPLLTSYLLLTARCSLLTTSTHCLLLLHTAHCSLLSAHCSLLTAHCLLLTTDYSPLTASSRSRTVAVGGRAAPTAAGRCGTCTRPTLPERPTTPTRVTSAPPSKAWASAPHVEAWRGCGPGLGAGSGPGLGARVTGGGAGVALAG